MEYALRQQGFALVAVLFVMVILGAALAFMIRQSDNTLTINNQQLLGARADLAAQAAMEWGIYQALENNQCEASRTITVTAFREFSLGVNCQAELFRGNITVYSITASAGYGTAGTGSHVWRQFTARVEP